MQLLKHLRTILQSKAFSLILIIITCLYVFINVKLINYQSIYKESDTNFSGIVENIKKTTYGYSITIKAKEKLILYTNEFNYNLGDKLYIEGKLEQPTNNTIPNTFNYKEYLYYNKIFYILKPNKIVLKEENKNLIYKLKTNLYNYMDTFKSNNYLKSFILGDTSYLGNDLYNSYQINGVCHLLAIGSLHITLLSILVLKLLKKLKVKDSISNLILFIIIYLFLLLTNYQVAILRVYLYMIFKYLNKKLKLNLSYLKIFLIITSFTLFLNPFYIYHKGFLYSYSISFILIMNRNNLKTNKLFKISLISFLYSIPFNIYFNYEINLLSIIYNLIYVPIFNYIVFPLAFLTLIFKPLDNLFYLVITNLNNLSYFLNNFTFGIIILKKINIIILIFYLVFMIYVIKSLFTNNKKILLILVLVIMCHYNINYFIKNDFYMVIDVSQGDSSLLYLDNKAYLIDTGGVYNKDISSNTILMLKSLGIKKIDYLILTHGDYDHMGESLNIVNKFKVSNVILNNDSYNNLEQELIKLLNKKHINYYQGVKVLNNRFYFLNTNIYDNENDNSNVIYFKYHDYKFLLMGDASTKRESDILEKYNLNNIDFLKVGHHGSDTSTSEYFIDKIKPKYSFISVGLNNRYGHPKKSVLDNLKNSKIYRTDMDGSILIDLKKNYIKTYSP